MGVCARALKWQQLRAYVTEHYPYCHTTPYDSGVYTNAACTVFSIPFVPCRSFTATAFVSHLRKRSGYPQANEWQIFLFKATWQGKPTEYLGWTYALIPAPLPYPNFKEFVMTLPDIPLEADQPYAWAFRCQYQRKWAGYNYLEFRTGFDDTCPFPPTTPPPYWYTSPGSQPDYTCNFPSSSSLWYLRTGGGLAFYEIRG